MRLVVQWLPLFLCCWACSVGAAADCSGSFAINSSDDVTTLNQCTTFTGNVSVAGKGIEDITLDGLKTVTGTFNIADSDSVLSISSTTLESVSALILNNLPKLTTLTLPALTNFSKLDFTGLTSLKGCEIATGALKHDVNDISIINTALENMDWLKWPVATTLTIAANMKLTDFSFPYDKISAGSSYQISINTALTNLDVSQLTGIYGSLATNGNNDRSLNFDKLETIDGYARLSGPFSNITMPHLTSINGALRADSTVDILSFCNWLSVQDQLYGHYDCTANSTDPTISSTVSKYPSYTAGPAPSVATSGTSGGGNNSKDNKSDLSTGAIIGIAVAMVVLISVILTTTALLFLRQRSRNKAQQVAAAMPEETKTHSTSTLGEELDASGIRYELGGGNTTHELPGAGPVRELDSQSMQELDCEKPYFRDQKPAPDSPIGRFELQ
ncbi:hypothetical protein BU25DRAFT_445579 [Macroventuria anomochaeta]|uniref:Uncharacterized protein n=1 Tax=Macroventuria anomochaeta TaxID=301207 RepID=A0ACB6SDL8_9PLEO|nr:uncharacterized protein BU25DRAFT_445579 [Macroventuria anomochaeta]KAF2631433.1 hypothetical protein BU25DRAFT_445579 [Macroventuria anomochaeta]